EQAIKTGLLSGDRSGLEAARQACTRDGSLQAQVRQTAVQNLPYFKPAFDVDTCTHTHGLEHVDGVFHHNIATRPGSKRAAANAGERCIKMPDAGFQSRAEIG